MSTNKKTPSQKTSSQSRRSPVSNRKPKTSKPGGKNQRLSNGLQECVPEPPKRSSSSLLGKKEVAKINLHTVRKLDSSVKSIKSTVPQVVLYQYESISNTWERTSVEGTLFVCEREPTPRYGFVILNTLHSESSIETISPGMEFRVQEPFLLYKNTSASKICGLCFQEMSVCREIGDLLNRLSHTAEQVTTADNGHPLVVPKRSASAIEFSVNQPAQGPKINVLELLESAGRNYMGQTFSDGTSSPDSLVSEPVQFNTHGVSTLSSSTVECRSTHSTPKQHTNIVSPASYPVKVPGVRVTSRSGSVSPQKQSRPYKGNQFQHAASFDSISGSGSLPSSNSFNPDSGIVRKLFTQCEQNGSLSQSVNSPSLSTEPPSSVPLQAISLDELEKQMAAEVSTPELNVPFSLLTTSANSTSSEYQPKNVLLQPSMFVSTAAPFPAKEHPVVSQPVSLSIQPPTPITSQHPSLGQQGYLFPSIPPLMHSAGMKAPPITQTDSTLPLQRRSSDSAFHAPVTPPHRAVSDPMPRGKGQIVAQPTLSPLPELVASQPRNTSPISSTLMSPHQFSTNSVQSSSSHDSVALSRSQLLQAFDYLLKHDEHFIDQLYSAYKQSVLSRQ